MLFTRCPDCQTNFRITADALRKADGQVRCGYCAAVFNAYEELRDGDGARAGAPSSETVPNSPDFLEETDEYRALDEEPGTGTAVPGGTVAEDPFPGADTHAAADPVPDSGCAGEQSTAPPPEAEADPDPELELELPHDEWTAFFEHAVENPLGEDLPQGGGAARETAGDTPEPSEPPPASIEQEIDEYREHAPDADAGGAVTADDVPRILEFPDSRESAAAPMSAPSLDPGQVDESLLTSLREPKPSEPDVSEDTEWRYETEIPGTGGGTLDGDARSAGAFPERFPGMRSLRARVSRPWTLGSAVLFAALLFQFIHHFRTSLAGQPLVGPLIRGAYALAGTQLTPEWDLSQYEIMDWVATADTGATGPGSLKISARIHNRGPRAQPYPDVRLELKDRWEATVGSRIFSADEYLPAEVSRQRAMTAGSTVPANLEVVDPGRNAYGFELDICTEQGGGVHCASDTVFR